MEETENIEVSTKDNPKKKSLIKRILKILLYLVLSFIGLNVLLYVLLSIPFIQQKAAYFAVDQLKLKLKTEVSIDEVRLSLFNHVTIKGIYLEDQSKDTLLYAKSLDATLSPLEFIKNNKLAITGITLNDFAINVNKKDSASDFNFQFVIDAFSSKDTIKTDTTKSSLVVVIENIKLNKGYLKYDILSTPRSPGIFNPSHISLSDFNAKVDLNSIDTYKFDIALNSLSAKEQSGMVINELKGRLYSEKSQLWVEGLSLNLPNSHLNFDKARYNLSSSEFEVDTEDTDINTKDLVAFLPNLKFLKNNIKLKTNIKGALPSISIDKVNLTYGEDLILEGKAHIADIQKYGNSDIGLSIGKLKASTSAITSFARLGDSTFIAPDILKKMGDIYLKGNISGQFSKFKLDVETWCHQGLLSLLATGSIDSSFTSFNIAANAHTRNFNIGKLLGDSTGLGRLTTQMNFKLRQSKKESLDAQVQGAIGELQYKKETLKNVPIKGFYNAAKMGLTAKADWKIGKIFVDANMTQTKDPDINVRLRLDTVHLERFYQKDNWVNPRLTLALNGKIKGLDINNLTGVINIDSLDFHDDNFTFQPGKFALEIGRNSANDKFVNLTSSLLSASISGQYSFTSLSDEFTSLADCYLPDVINSPKRIKKYENNFSFSVKVKNTEEAGRIFSLPVDIILPANINGHIHTADKEIKIQGDIPHIRLGETEIKNSIINISALDSAFNITGYSKLDMAKGGYNLSLNLDGANNQIGTTINITSDNTDININGKIEATAQFSQNERKELISSLKITPSDVMIDRLALNLLPAKILNIGKRTEVSNFGIGLNKKKYFEVNGTISDQKTDSLKAYFNHAEVGELLNAFDIKDIEGCVHGNILITNLLDQPELYTKDFEVADIVVYGDSLGSMSMESMWSDDYGGARLNAQLNKGDENYAELDGTIYTYQDSLDLQLRLEKLPLAWAQPLLTGMLNKVSGSVSTNLMIEGSTKAPKLRGFIGFNNTQIGVDYTNVVYTISDTIKVSPDRIGFDHLALKDSKGNTANIKATVIHKNFEDMHYSLDMDMKNLMVLNTEHRIDSMFYGLVFASGTVKIDGDNNGIKMDVKIKNDKNSALNILLPQRSEASNYKSVVYINVPENNLINSEKDKAILPKKEPLPIMLDVSLDVTPDLDIGVIIDQTTGDAMKAKGSGTILFNYNMLNENMSTRGDFTLIDGNVRLNLQKIKTLDFKIREGSKLYFIGDPMKTRFDMTAYRRVSANLQTLDNSFAMDGGTSKVDVDCVLGITGNIDKMDLTYNISLPDANDDIQRKVNSIISTDEQKIRQFAYLIASGMFYSSGSSGANFTDGLWTSVLSGSLSNVMTSLVGNILGDKWQIGANLGTSDGSLNNVDMSVNVSRKFWDDKLTLRTNLGYHTDNTGTTNNSFVGDFDLEYRLNNLWTLKAYNHTNDQYYKQNPYTQGIGVVYNKEASTLKRLFQSLRPWQLRRGQTPLTPLRSDSTKVEENKQPATIKREDEKK